MGTKNPVSYHELLLQCQRVWVKHQPNWRYGQILFNTIADTRPDISEVVRGTLIDPFYCTSPSDIHPMFWALLQEKW